MFDIAFSELLVIAIVGLVVIGPERLPKVARMLGHLLGRAQRYVNQVKADISQEMQLDELKKLQGEVHDSMRSLEKNIRDEVHRAEETVEQAVQPVKNLLSEASENDASHAHVQIETPQYSYPHAGEEAQETSSAPDKQITDQR